MLSIGQLFGVLVVLLVILLAFYLWMKDVPMFIGTMDLTGKTCIVTGANAGTPCGFSWGSILIYKQVLYTKYSIY